MISGVQTTAYSPSIQESVLRPRPEYLLRVQLNAELLEFKRLLDETSLEDETTGAIKNWCEAFSKALRTPTDHAISVDEQATLDKFIEIMKEEILQDFFNFPLEEISYLGSDGETYGHRALCIHLSSMPVELAGKSPVFHQLDIRFTVNRHPIVEAMTQWLKKRGSPIEILPDIEQRYQELVAANTLPLIPTAEEIRRQDQRKIFQERARRVIAERTALEQEQSAAAAAFGMSSEQKLNARVDSRFKELLAQARESNARAAERFEAIKKRDVRQTEELEKEIRQIDQNIHAINASIDNLENKFEGVNVKLSDQEKEIRRVQLEIDRLKLEIKRWKKKKRLAVIRTLCVAAVGIGLSIVFPGSAAFIASASAGAGCFTVAPALERRPRAPREEVPYS